MSNLYIRGRATEILLGRCCRRVASPHLLKDNVARSFPIRSYRASILEPRQKQILSKVPKNILYECRSLYLLLQRHGDNIVGTISQDFRPTSLKPVTWLYRVRIELHDVCKGPICIQAATEATSKSAAKRKAFSEVLEKLGKSLVAGIIAFHKRSNYLGGLARERFTMPGNQGRQWLETKALKKTSGTSSMPDATPSAAEAALIAASSIDLEALKVVAASGAYALQAAPTRVLVIDVEKHEAGPELLEIGIVELDLSTRCASTTHFIIEYAKGTLREQYYCQSDPEAFAYHGRVVRCSPSEAVAQIQLAVDRAAGGYIVGHSVRSSDIPWLKGAGVKFDAVFAIDVAAVEMAVVRTHQPMGLERLATVSYGLSLLGPSHNAGNDAVATAAVFAEQLRRHTHYHAGWITGELLQPASPPWVLSRNAIPLHQPFQSSRRSPKSNARKPQAPAQSALKKYARLAKLSDLILQSPTLQVRKIEPGYTKEQYVDPFYKRG
jgi:DNA polymerase III epsilon subunit-like protein